MWPGPYKYPTPEGMIWTFRREGDLTYHGMIWRGKADHALIRIEPCVGGTTKNINEHQLRGIKQIVLGIFWRRLGAA